MALFKKARGLLEEFKGESYTYGAGVLDRVGSIAALSGAKVVLVRDAFAGSEGFIDRIKDSMAAAGLEIAGEVDGAGPNCPREDLLRIGPVIQRAPTGRDRELRRGQHDRRRQSGRGIENFGGDRRTVFRHRAGNRNCEEKRKKTVPACRHSDRGQLGSASDEVFEYHRPAHRSEEVDRRCGNRTKPPCVRLRGNLLRPPPQSLTADGALDGYCALPGGIVRGGRHPCLRERSRR